MDVIYSFVKENPIFVTWCFALLNIGWAVFIYFDKKRQDRKLKEFENSLKFNADRRLKVFELKANHYSKYVADLDAFGRKNQVELPEKFAPLFNKYLKDYLAATEQNDAEKIRKAITWFGEKISDLMRDRHRDVLILKSESNKLKLIATDEMLHTLSELERLTLEAYELANTYMKNFTEIFMSDDQTETDEYKAASALLANETLIKSDELMQQMRAEISGI